MSYRYRLVLSTVVGLAIGWFSVGLAVAQFQTGIEGRTYTNTDYNFRISLPEELTHWELQGNIPKLLFMMTTDEATLANKGVIANFSVEVETFPKDVTLDAYLDVSLLALKIGIKGLNDLIIEAVELDGKNAYQLIYTGDAGGGMRVKFFQVITVDQQKGYMLTGTTIPVTMPISGFLAIQDTFQFLNTAVSVNPKKLLATTWASIK